jgi:sterol desaturase/sphingolipid hydroxylase (fatty acid hydroxylase superfamily)
MDVILEYFTLWVTDLLINFSLYFILSGLAFYFIWKSYSVSLNRRRIQEKQKASDEQIRKEIWRSVRTLIIFASIDLSVFYLEKTGITQIYSDIDEFGLTYFFISIFLMLLIHDTYFYWTHRLMHHKLIFKHVHKVHHESIDTTPFTAFSFHTIEAIIEYGISPLLIFLIPTHFGSLILFQFLMTAFNVIGHLGYELYPSNWYRISLLKYKTTSVHHNLHHSKFNGNYGLYFTWWDRMLRTEFTDTRVKFEETTNRKLLTISDL